MSRKHPWDFKNRREQHKALVEVERCHKQYCKAYYKAYHETKHTKEGWRKVDYLRCRDWFIKARVNGWVK